MHTRKKRRHGADTVPPRKPIVPLRWQPLLWLAVVTLAIALVALAPAIDDKVDSWTSNPAASLTPVVPLSELATANRAHPAAGNEPPPAPLPASSSH